MGGGDGSSRAEPDNQEGEGSGKKTKKGPAVPQMKSGMDTNKRGEGEKRARRGGTKELISFTRKNIDARLSEKIQGRKNRATWQRYWLAAKHR